MARKGGHGRIEVLDDLFMERDDLVHPFLGEGHAFADPLHRERHHVPVDDIADAFQIAGRLKHGQRAPGLWYSSDGN